MDSLRELTIDDIIWLEIDFSFLSLSLSLQMSGNCTSMELSSKVKSNPDRPQDLSPTGQPPKDWLKRPVKKKPVQQNAAFGNVW